MKSFRISQLLIYDPTRLSQKRKPIQIDIQQAKIITYFPLQVELQQKCNTVGMAEGVYNFSHSLLLGKQQQNNDHNGWQVVNLDICTLLLKEVQQNIWLFVKLQHQKQNNYTRLGGEDEQLSYIDSTFNEQICTKFMNHFYRSFQIFYGKFRGWVVRQKIQQLSKILSVFINKYQQIFKFQNFLDIMSYFINDIRQIPLDVNSNLKFVYFKNVLQSYNNKIQHMIIFSGSYLSYTTLKKQDTQFFTNYLFANGQPYHFVINRKNRLSIVPEIPKQVLIQKFGVAYNSKIVGMQDKQSNQNISKQVDLLGSNNRYQLIQVWLQGQEYAHKILFYSQNSMLYLIFFKDNPTTQQVYFLNRFIHDNNDKFMHKINQILPSMNKLNDPYKFIYHNMCTFSGKSTIKDWKNYGSQIRNVFESLQKQDENSILYLHNQGTWVYGVRRLNRILIMIINGDFNLNKIQEYVNKMAKQYFIKAYI